MSPTDGVGGAALKAKPAVVNDGRRMTNDLNLEEMSAVPAAALDKILAMLGNLSERMGRMESSKAEQVNGKRKDSAESIIFGPVLGSGAGINLQALVHTPPPKRPPYVSAATYFGARRAADARTHVPDPTVQANANYVANQAPEPGFQRQ